VNQVAENSKEWSYMRTSGGGDRDLTMLTVPLLMLVAFGLSSGGGVMAVLRTLERTLWAAMDWLGHLVA
jgi:hypothetical protein